MKKTIFLASLFFVVLVIGLAIPVSAGKYSNVVLKKGLISTSSTGNIPTLPTSFFDVFTEMPVDQKAVDSFFDIFTELKLKGDISQMNKAELIEVIASETGLTKADAKRALEAFISATKSLKKGSSIALVGFGDFTVSRTIGAGQVTEILKSVWTPPIGHVDHGKSISKRKARTGRNPQTGATLQIPAKKVVRFKAGADLAKTVA